MGTDPLRTFWGYLERFVCPFILGPSPHLALCLMNPSLEPFGWATGPRMASTGARTPIISEAIGPSRCAFAVHSTKLRNRYLNLAGTWMGVPPM